MNPTNEHREQARRIATDLCIRVWRGGMGQLICVLEFDKLLELVARDAEAGKVLEGLALRWNIKQGGHCWCYKDLTNDAKPHSDNCSAARDLYSKLHATEKGEVPKND